MGNVHIEKLEKVEEGDGGVRLTRKNPSGSYRIPMCNQKTLRLEWQMDDLTVFGEIADRLGAYEDLGTVDELRELQKLKVKK